MAGFKLAEILRGQVEKIDLRLIEIDCGPISRLDDLFSAFSEALEFPDYFGRNWPAFDEVITDLEWLPAKGYVLVLRNADSLLASEPEERGTFFRVLTSAAEEWSHPVVEGAEWDRPAIPFHILLEVDGDGLDVVIRMLEECNIENYQLIPAEDYC
ncbi:barstar family protein [Microbispora sp. CA-102843]|uniref:barstar family protein n=1 Tax=Microbispora sp. CA-102843 TaxID=3239952 RepID=UPI003D910B77